MPIRDTDPRESFSPLGAPIRREPAPTPAPRPEPIGNGMFRRPDGTLETRIPPPPAAPAMRQGMWDRDNPRSKLSPCVMAQWDAAMADAGFPAPRMVADWMWPTTTECVSMSLPHGDVLGQQRADWLTIPKEVQEMLAVKPQDRLPRHRDELVSKIRELQERHRLELEPYMQMLVRIEACAPPPRLVIPRDAPRFDADQWFSADSIGKAKD